MRVQFFSRQIVHSQMAAARQPKNLTLPRVRNHGTCFQAASKHEFSKWQCTINWRHQSDWTCDPTKQLNLRSARAIRLWFGHNPCIGIWIVALLPVGKVHEAPVACPGSPFERPLLALSFPNHQQRSRIKTWLSIHTFNHHYFVLFR